MTMPFSRVLADELDAINFRRGEVREGAVARARHQDARHPAASPGDTHLVRPRSNLSLAPSGGAARRGGDWHMTTGNDLTGLALSGGGIRSAAFGLGVLQGLDSLTDHGEPHVLDAIDYLSTVSGGGYIGTSLIAAMMQPGYTFPFDNRVSSEETPETQHLRNYANFLAPHGPVDYLLSAALVLRGLLVNAVIVAPVLLLLAIGTVACTPLLADLSAPNLFGTPLADIPLLLPIAPSGNFGVTTLLLFAEAILLIGTAVWTSWTFTRGSLQGRTRLASLLGWSLVALGGVAFLELQPFLLRGLFASYNHPGSHGQSALGDLIPTVAKTVAGIAAVLVPLGQKLVNLARATIGEASRGGAVKRLVSRLAIALAGIVVPLLLWIAYLYLCFWAIRPDAGTSNPFSPGWVYAPAVLLDRVVDIDRIGTVGSAYVVVAVVLGLVSLLIKPNANSLHRLYRDRLSTAFLMRRPGCTTDARGIDGRRFSSLKPRDAQGWTPTAALAPFLIVNTAINMDGSDDLRRRGRNADTFTFSPLHVGSEVTGYVPTAQMEAAVPDLCLATAMATSGAAASANMGSQTVKALTFSLSLLNIRLGYWLANPRQLRAVATRLGHAIANIGPLYFAMETAAQLNDRRLNVYLTDGGHVENLGVYELLKRRCKVILAVDAEADPGMVFPSLITLQVMARIDLGIRIELPWDGLKTSALAVTGDAPHGPSGAPGHQGPHAAIGRIIYDDTHTGVLIYLKSSMSGDESDYVVDYKRRNPSFPHESTLDQFFTEGQFEAYRSLGYHALRGLMTGTDRYMSPRPRPRHWTHEVTEALRLLNIPTATAEAVAGWA